jgi:hypothetical protein
MLHLEAIYLYPTPELVKYLSKLIYGYNTIEIGSGKGLLCDALGIKGTDSKYQATQEGRMLYKLMQQPTIKYPEHVEKLEALEAIEKYKPHTVIAAWCTEKCRDDKQTFGFYEGFEFDKILQKVERLIFIGCDHVHKQFHLFKEHKYIEFRPDWIKSRSQQNNNFIAVFNHEIQSNS